MKFIKKLIPILLSSICFCPNICAMKSSVSMPENLYKYACDDASAEEIKEFDTSLYNLYKRCQHITITASDTPAEILIKDTAYICAVTFEKISDLLRSKDGLNKRYYASCLTNYVPLIEKLNYILFDIIPYKIETTDPCFPTSEETKRNVLAASSIVPITLKKYRDIFDKELRATFLEATQIQQMYVLLCETYEGVSYISGLSIFRN